MGVYAKLVNHEEQFLRAAGPSTIILNDIDDSSAEQKSKLNQMIYTTSGDVFSNVPSCDCGALRAAYNRGVVCGNCHTPVVSRIETKLESKIWIRTPNGCKPMMNVTMWSMLDDLFTHKGFSVLQYIANSSYQIDKKSYKESVVAIAELEKLGINNRGWNYLHDNFDFIINALLGNNKLMKSGRDKQYRANIRKMIDMYRPVLFTNYLPLPNKALHVIEENEAGRFREKSIDNIIDVARTFIGIDLETNNFSHKTKEKRLVNSLNTLAEYYSNYNSANSQKEGIWRRLVFGTRTNFTSRTVISSLTAKHEYDEIHMPWGAGVEMFRYHIINKLKKKGMSPLQCINFLNKYAVEYHPLIDQILKELVAECPYKGIPAVFSRNPILMVGSTQMVFITKFKTDVTDLTISNSILTVVPFNADYDGDAMHTVILLDNMIAKAFEKLAPHISGFSTEKPHEVSSNLWLPKPVISSIFNWMSDPKQNIATDEQNKEMERMFA